MANLTLYFVIVIALACFLATSCLFSLDGINLVSYVFRFEIECSYQFDKISYDVSPLIQSRANAVQKKRIAYSMCFSGSGTAF